MSSEQATVPVQCLPAREYLSVSYIKSMLHGFVYEYETPKIVTIHSISSKTERRSRVGNADRLCLVALMCRLIQVLILIYGIAYLMIHKKGYQETNTSIISSITLKVKVRIDVERAGFSSDLTQGIGYNQTGENQTLVIDGAGNGERHVCIKRDSFVALQIISYHLKKTTLSFS